MEDRGYAPLSLVCKTRIFLNKLIPQYRSDSARVRITAINLKSYESQGLRLIKELFASVTNLNATSECFRQESNPHQEGRNHLFFPLNYGNLLSGKLPTSHQSVSLGRRHSESFSIG